MHRASTETQDRLEEPFDWQLDDAPPVDDRPATTNLAHRERPPRGRPLVAIAAIVAIGALAAAIASHLILLARLQALEHSSLDRSVVARGLGLRSPADDALAAALKGLTDAAIESGAWHSQLAERGVDPSVFLGRLIRLASAHDNLSRLAGVSDALEQLAGHEDAILALARQRHQLDDLSDQVGTLMALSDAWPQLLTVVGSAEQLDRLAGITDPLGRLAELEPALTTLTTEAAELAMLAGEATTLADFIDNHLVATEQLAQHSGDILDLAQRRKRSIDRLAEAETLLLSLAAQQDSLSHLAHEHAQLLRYAQARNLLRLDQVAPELERLAGRAAPLLDLLEEHGSAGSGGATAEPDDDL